MKYCSQLIGLTMAALILWVPDARAQGLEEVVVTAQRRAENLNDVAIAVNAFQASDIEDLGITDITKIAGQSPNLSIKYTWGNSMPVYTIRGVGMNSFQGNDTASVGLFVDEIFQTSMTSMGAFLYDIERVEVLKGPQGTLFGRNTNGGAVNYLTRAPSFEETSGYVRADFARFAKVDVEAAIGGPINDKWAARASLFTTQQGDGWVYDRTSGTDIGEVDIWAGRVQLLYQHSDTTSARFILYGSSDRSQPVYFQHIGTRAIGGGGAQCQAYMEGRLDPLTCVDILGYSDTDNDPYAGDYTNRFDTEINSEATLKNDNIGATLLIDSEIGGLEFRSITSIQTYDRFQPKESDGNPALFLDFLFASQVEAYSQEFRLASDTDGKFSWIAGVQASYDSVEETPNRIGYLDALGVRYDLTYKQDRTNLAGYAQGLWQLSDEWRLEIGGRVLYDDVDFFQQVGFDIGFGNPFTPVIISGCPDPNPNPVDLDCALDDTAFTGKIGLDWSPNDNLMIYGSVASGYKPGGFNGGLNPNPLLNRPYEEEEVISLELGLKATLWDGRAQLNAAVFDYSYQGLQAATPRESNSPSGVLNFLTNLSDADISGAEVEFRAKLTENLEVNLGLGLLDTKNNDPGTNFDGPFGMSTRKLANSPEETFNASVAWDIPMGARGSVRLFTDYSYDGDHYKTIVNVQALKTTNEMWNARATWTSPDENLQVYVYGRNLTDEVNVVDTLGAGGGLGWAVQVLGMPRVIGAGASYSF